MSSIWIEKMFPTVIIPMIVIMVCCGYLLPVLGMYLKSKNLCDPRGRKNIEQKIAEILKDTANKYLSVVEETGCITDTMKSSLIQEITERVVNSCSWLYKDTIDCFVTGTENPVPAGQSVEFLLKVVCKEAEPEIVVQTAVSGISRNEVLRNSIEQKLNEVVQSITSKYLPNVEKTGYVSDGTKALLISELLEKLVESSYAIQRRTVDCLITGTEEPVPEGRPVELSVKVVCKSFKPELVVQSTAYGVSRNKLLFKN